MIKKILENSGGKKMERPKPVVLVIMDGWGEAPHSEYNAITCAKTPVFDSIRKLYPNGLINASEQYVGLPEKQMGNSETGHLNIGGGRVALTDFARIENAIADGSLEKEDKLRDFIEKTKKGTGVVHLLGLISDGGVHSHQAHTTELARIFANNGLKVKLHLFTDGRDVPPQSALEFIDKLQKDISKMQHQKNISIATIGGRAYAMDRDTNWETTTKPAYDAMVLAKGEVATDAKMAVEQSYKKDKTDQYIFPTVIGDYKGMRDGDSLFISNFRKDRVQQIATAFLEPEFNDFVREKKINFSAQLSMTEYSKRLSELMPPLFLPEQLKNTLAEVISRHGLKQLHITETEKYSHVTEFFNGGRDKSDLFVGEKHILVPSPKVATYDLKPEMSAHEITKELVAAINEKDPNKQYDFIVVNYANADMVGHTANKAATIKAVETVDECLGEVKKAVLDNGGAMIVTADHGNADQLIDPKTGKPHTAHTTNLVPVVMISKNLEGRRIKIPVGSLCDLAPTILQFMNIEKPKEMTGASLLIGHDIHRKNPDEMRSR